MSYSQVEVETDISDCIDFSQSPPFSVSSFLTNQTEHFDFTSMQSEIPDQVVPPLMGPISEQQCLSAVPSYLQLNQPSLSTWSLTPTYSAEILGMFAGSLMMDSDVQIQDPLQSLLTAGNLKELCNNGNQQVVGKGDCSTPLASAISVLDETSLTVGKLSFEQRKEKIHRYIKKRNERNFTKKIKYACRKTLADSRPRVRGRFAKNDDFGDIHRSACSHYEQNEDDEVTRKEKEERVDFFRYLWSL